MLVTPKKLGTKKRGRWGGSFGITAKLLLESQTHEVVNIIALDNLSASSSLVVHVILPRVIS